MPEACPALLATCQLSEPWNLTLRSLSGAFLPLSRETRRAEASFGGAPRSSAVTPRIIHRTPRVFVLTQSLAVRPARKGRRASEAQSGSAAQAEARAQKPLRPVGGEEPALRASSSLSLSLSLVVPTPTWAHAWQLSQVSPLPSAMKVPLPCVPFVPCVPCREVLALRALALRRHGETGPSFPGEDAVQG